MSQRTRFVCVSDTHAYTPSEAGFKLPAGDVLIHAGDLTNQGSKSELRKTMNWIAAADFEVKIVICGNHDITLDAAFYAEHGSKFHGQHLEDPQECMDVVIKASPSIVFLRHQSAIVRLTRPDGPNTVFKVFGSPFSQSPGTWAYGYESTHAAALWDQIPLDADLVVTHTPPHSHCDSRAVGAVGVGCKALRQALSRVRPLLAVCGHVHESRGFERVRWSQSSASSSPSSNARFKESDEDQVVKGELPVPGSKKQSLVDLTGRKAQRLDNHGCATIESGMSSSQDTLAFPCPMDQPLPRSRAHEQETKSPPSCPQPARQKPRPQRRETCIVNAAILATSWPHRGGKRFHAPIVVDLELPTW
ncbi:Ser/Thr protein phosphatase family protein, partial [Aspergillus steynii IBT 23096]